jgi:hypothetical protein
MSPMQSVSNGAHELVKHDSTEDEPGKSDERQVCVKLSKDVVGGRGSEPVNLRNESVLLVSLELAIVFVEQPRSGFGSHC